MGPVIGQCNEDVTKPCVCIAVYSMQDAEGKCGSCITCPCRVAHRCQWQRQSCGKEVCFAAGQSSSDAHLVNVDAEECCVLLWAHAMPGTMSDAHAQSQTQLTWRLVMWPLYRSRTAHEIHQVQTISSVRHTVPGIRTSTPDVQGDPQPPQGMVTYMDQVGVFQSTDCTAAMITASPLDATAKLSLQCKWKGMQTDAPASWCAFQLYEYMTISRPAMQK